MMDDTLSVMGDTSPARELARSIPAARRTVLPFGAGAPVVPMRSFRPFSPEPSPPTPGPLRGAVDLVDARRLAGWAQDLRMPEQPVRLEIVAGGQVVARAVADRYREELRRAGVGSGEHGFSVALPPDVANGAALTVRRASDGAILQTWPAGLRARRLCQLEPASPTAYGDA